MNGLLRLLLRVWFVLLFGAIFLMLLVVGSVGVLVFMAWALVTGKRLDANAMFSNVLRTSQRFGGGKWSLGEGPPPSSAPDVVDVQAREVRDALEDDR